MLRVSFFVLESCQYDFHAQIALRKFVQSPLQLLSGESGKTGDLRAGAAEQSCGGTFKPA